MALDSKEETDVKNVRQKGSSNETAGGTPPQRRSRESVQKAKNKRRRLKVEKTQDRSMDPGEAEDRVGSDAVAETQHSSTQKDASTQDENSDGNIYDTFGIPSSLRDQAKKTRTESSTAVPDATKTVDNERTVDVPKSKHKTRRKKKSEAACVEFDFEPEKERAPKTGSSDEAVSLIGKSCDKKLGTPKDPNEIRNLRGQREPTTSRVEQHDKPIPLDCEVYFHGYLPIGVARRQLVEHGQFVVYITEVNKDEALMLSVCHQQNVYNYLVHKFRDMFFYVNDYVMAKSVPALIETLRRDSVVLEPAGPVLVTPVPRPRWIWKHEKVTTDRMIGKGAFGEVYIGTSGKRKRPCAIKLLKVVGNAKNDQTNVTTEKSMHKPPPASSIRDKMMFINEAIILQTVQHKYVVQLYGVACIRDPLMLVMELCSKGSLLKILREQKPPHRKKQEYIGQILSGMTFIERQKLIHRDLAARNVLVDATDRCKISDFGISVFGEEINGHKSVKVAIRWLSPEAIARGIFSSKSDVWSFGVTAWEVYANGAVPYGQVKKLKEVKIGIVRGSLRLKPTADMLPSECEMLEKCFLSDRHQRPPFLTLKHLYKAKTMAMRVREAVGMSARGPSKRPKSPHSAERTPPAVQTFFESKRNRRPAKN